MNPVPVPQSVDYGQFGQFAVIVILFPVALWFLGRHLETICSTFKQVTTDLRETFLTEMQRQRDAHAREIARINEIHERREKTMLERTTEPARKVST